MTQRVLLRLAFDGSRFWGSQRQPERPTVDGAVLEALDRAGYLADAPDFRPQGRTDRGVSARDYPVAVTVEAAPEDVAGTVAGGTQGIIPWAGAVVEDGFNPRHAAQARTYRYIAPRGPGLDLEATAQAWSAFRGKHDMRAFSRPDRTKQRAPVREITDVLVDQRGEALVFEVRGRSFLWNQVRRMVGAALEVGLGRLSLEQVEDALTGQTRLQHPRTAPAEGLVLTHVDLPVDTAPLTKAAQAARARASPGLHRAFQRYHALKAVLGEDPRLG